MSLKESALAIWKILRLFVYTLTAYEKYSVLNREYLTQLIRMQLSMKTKDFLNFFSAISKPTLSLEHFQKKMTLIANVFLKLQTPKNAVR